MKKIVLTVLIALGSMVAFTGCVDENEIFEQVDQAKSTTTSTQGKGL